MRAGELRHRVTIQQLVESQNEYGEIATTPQTLAAVWGAVEDLSGREYFAAQQVSAEVSTRIRIRYRGGVVPKMQAVANGRTYDILAVLDPDGRRRELHLMCKAVV
ncbi:MAG: phage head closure protein [Betaproteobacteria bacterium]